MARLAGLVTGAFGEGLDPPEAARAFLATLATPGAREILTRGGLERD